MSNKNCSSSDLRNRERVNFVIDANLANGLRKYSKDVSIPMSRLIDNAIKSILATHTTINSEFQDIFPISHVVKVHIFKKVDSDIVQQTLKTLENSNKKYIINDCFMVLKETQTTMGVEISFYIDDTEEHLVNTLLKDLNLSNIPFSISLNGKYIKKT